MLLYIYRKETGYYIVNICTSVFACDIFRVDINWSYK